MNSRYQEHLCGVLPCYADGVGMGEIVSAAVLPAIA